MHIDANVRKEGGRAVGMVVGTLLYAVGVNLFLRPLQLYSGGFVGFAQLFQTLLEDGLGLNLAGLNLSGMIFYLMNIPGLIWAYRAMRRKFVVKTIFAVTCVTVLLTVVPIPDAPILEEKLGNCLMAGLLAGVGVGLVLRMGASDGGLDLIGMLLIQTRDNFSVGKVNLAVNCLLYGLCMVLFDLSTAIYSMMYSVVLSLLCDKVHTQNINVQVLIITKKKDLESLKTAIMGQMRRGITGWGAYGGYTGENETILMTVVSKYEIAQLKAVVHEFDPHAFVLLSEGINVDGYFLKKLT